MKRIIEYEVTYKDHNVDHIDWREARKMVNNPPADVILIERVPRYGDGVEEFDEKRQYETLFEKSEECVFCSKGEAEEYVGILACPQCRRDIAKGFESN